mmetsp:Transcript_18588/g.31159  ORF Transcript_18588/g.31159 Transcript_18588/m.31159 type:complete len:289 (-) Transcript_18588:371-1237(-)|eukprot:CAMPEP_0174988210 /NCGR_PEP_ID=MMETSP0004_2-20121128/19990_1 /TAXON_ID=420556 /ORGANISM="Ochromonas sp., Strain CCMP1393" /LENGTH=288 /DNA_ID=CAMNT_0016241383 /DNA_START=29 /DNA_END=895 /DNA_ORIENTATION=-
MFELANFDIDHPAVREFQQMIAKLKGIHANIRRLWAMEEGHFDEFWDAMDITTRENFLVGACKELEFENSRIVYSARYERSYCLAPDMAPTNITNSQNLSEIIAEWIDESALSLQGASIVKLFRELRMSNQFPMDPDEVEFWDESYSKIEKGDLFRLNNLHHADTAAAGGFGAPIVVKKPKQITKSVGGKVNLYDQGIICSNSEFTLEVYTLDFILSVLGSILDAYREKMYGASRRNEILSVDTAHGCDYCGMYCDTIKKCAKCMVVGYCSKECQRAAWKAHKKTCSK